MRRRIVVAALLLLVTSASFIHMEYATADTTIDYESKWATLTFGVR